MRLITLMGPGFGIERTQEGGAINFHDADSNTGYQIPANGDSLVQMILQMAACLTPEQKKQCAPAFNGGIHLPNGPLRPSDLGMNEDGPPR